MNTQNKFMVVKTGKTLKWIELEKLYAITGDSYCSTFLIDGQDNFTSTKTLKEVESLFPNQHNYLRINKNTIINVAKIKELLYENRMIYLDNGAEFQVSVRKMKQIKQMHYNDNRLKLNVNL